MKQTTPPIQQTPMQQSSMQQMPVQQVRRPTDALVQSCAPGARAAKDSRFIYIACPWSPAGGGMYKVADYLIQAQAPAGEHAAQLRPLDTRGPGSAVASMWMLARAIGKIVRGRIDGNLAGVHVNMAERLSLFRKGAVVVTCRAVGVPVVIHLHAQMQRFYRSLPRPLRALTRWMFSLGQGVVVIGAAPRRFVVEELGVSPRRIDTVINGVPGPVTARPPRADADFKRVVFVGRLCEAKGVSDLLQALHLADIDRDRVKVTLAGNGEVERYRALARNLGIDGFVEFAGWCDQARVDALLRESDLLVLPSHDEVLPLVVLEALANGVAVVCTPIGELPRLLKKGQTACFVPPKDAEALARTLEQVLGDPELLASLGRNGRMLYERQFSMERFFANVARIHQRCFGVSAQLHEPSASKEAS